MNETIESFHAFLKNSGVMNIDNLEPGEDIRVQVQGDGSGEKSGKYSLYLNEGNGIPAGFFNNYRTNEYSKWKGTSSEQSKPINFEEVTKRKDSTRIQKENIRQTRFRDFKVEWDSLKPANQNHPYIKDKDIKSSFFKRTEVRQDKNSNLVLPVIDSTGKITNLQRIWSTGNKQLEKDGTIAGSFIKINGNQETGFVLIAEGISTGATVNEITGIDTFTSLTGNNLSNVAHAVRNKYPEKTIIIAADNDYHLTIRDIPIKNSGMENAEKAAAEVGGHVASPPFNMAELASGRTDWNDYYKDKGFARTRDSLKSAFQKVISLTKEGFAKQQTKDSEIER